MTDRLITANARKVTGREFFDAVFGVTQEQRDREDRLMVEQCIRAIQRGSDMYGWPPCLVERGEKIIAERQVTERDLRFTMELQRKRA